MQEPYHEEDGGVMVSDECPTVGGGLKRRWLSESAFMSFTTLRFICPIMYDHVLSARQTKGLDADQTVSFLDHVSHHTMCFDN